MPNAKWITAPGRGSCYVPGDKRGRRVSVYAEVIEVMKRRNAKVESIVASLDKVHRSTTDNNLRIFLSEVRGVLSSKLLENMRVTLPLDRAPYQALAAYCQRQAVQASSRSL
jgi:hypothetical protein